MQTYLSMLRGIDVSGQKIIRMHQLKALYESIGFASMTTYIQSGNVIFRSRSNDSASVNKLIVEAVMKAYGFPVTVIIRRPTDLETVIRNSPFIGLSRIDESKLHVTFLNAKPGQALAKELIPHTAQTTDEYKLVGNEIHLYCPNGYGKTLLSNAFFEKHLKVIATTRNWKTVCTLFALASVTAK
jgi:uncharacterized protein (DUF1697 family)